MKSTKRVARASIAILAFTALTLAAISLLPAPVLLRLLALWMTRPPDATPPRPAILAPRGGMPAGVVAFEEWIQYGGESYALVGSGFFLTVGDGDVVGVATAHSMDLGNPGQPLERIAFAVSGQTGYLVEFDTLFGPPGVSRTGNDLTVDYVLLRVSGQVDSSLALMPDPRGAPQPGERVSLFSGVGDGSGGQRVLEGTVQSVEATAVWVLMDDYFDAGRMSGSPLISRHTGQVVGMAIAVSPRGSRLTIGFHPIASIVRRAEAAEEFPKIGEYQTK